MSANISGTLIWSSFHLKISTPPLSSTRKHSAKPLRMSSCQSAVRLPYLSASHDFFACADKVRRVENDYLKTVVGKGQSAEVKAHVGVDFEMALIVPVFQAVALISGISKQAALI